MYVLHMQVQRCGCNLKKFKLNIRTIAFDNWPIINMAPKSWIKLIVPLSTHNLKLCFFNSNLIANVSFGD